jgi:LysM repeat protein
VVIERVYIVQRKDTLFKIASENGMTVDELKKLNNLSSNEIKTGQNSTLPANREPQVPALLLKRLTDEEVQKRDRIRSDLYMPVEGKVISEYGLRMAGAQGN